MKRIFQLEWDDAFGEQWLNKDNLLTLIKTETCLGEGIEIDIKDLTEEGVGEPEPRTGGSDREQESSVLRGEKPEKAELETPPKHKEIGEPAEQEPEKCQVCCFRRTSKCHRFPPQVVMANGVKQSFNPPAPDGEWCGEFEPIKKNEAE